MNKVYPFFKANHPFSQWYPSKFTIDRIEYWCAEQYMMAAKASVFNDIDTLMDIMQSKDQRTIKKLGRQVKNYNNKVWSRVRYHFVLLGNHAKFTQNPNLTRFLLNVSEELIAEASPYDIIWGVGLSENNPDIQFPKKWKGLNLLGKVIMEVRSNLSHDGS